MKIEKSHCEAIMRLYPESQGNNTNFLINFLEQTCKSRNIEINWENIKEIMIKDYKPENIMRKRREHCPSSEEQLVKEEETRTEYTDRGYSFEEIGKII